MESKENPEKVYVESFMTEEEENATEEDIKDSIDNWVENPATFDKVVEMLTSNHIDYTLTTHEPTRTSQESADVRGATLASGAKAMLIVDHSKKLNLVYFLCVMSAAKKISWK